MPVKKTLHILLLLLSAASLWAVPARRVSITVEQPDGTRLSLTMRGDEHFHCLVTSDGVPVARHTTRHDESDIAGAEYYYFPSGHVAFDIYKPLGRTRREYPCRPVARDIEGSARSLPAAHAKDHCLCLDLKHPVRPVHRGHCLVGRDPR